MDHVELSSHFSMQRLGKYQLLDPIGAGPCGTVTRAKIYGVVGFEREFAIKRFYPAAIAAAGIAQNLSTAARAYAALEHPRIAKMAEFLVAQGQTFAAVECVAGLDLGRLLADLRVERATLPAGGVLAVLSQCARAVGFAHGRGLFHLGLCPANLMLMVEGECKVTDFGFLSACMPPRPVAEPRLAQRIGYLAPEQLIGEPVSAATDVFALGVIGFEMLTGQQTFSGESPIEVQQAILSSQPPEPPLPRAIVRVLQRALARSPFERYPDARAFADALDAALRIAPVSGTRKDIGDRVRAALGKRAEMNEQALSGVVPLPTAPFERMDEPPSRDSAMEMATEEFVRDPGDLVGLVPTTLAGVVPPPYSSAQVANAASLAKPTVAPAPVAIPSIAIGQRLTQQGVPPVPRVQPRPESRPPPVPTIPAIPPITALPAATLPTSDAQQEFGSDVTLEADFASTGEFRDLSSAPAPTFAPAVPLEQRMPTAAAAPTVVPMPVAVAAAAAPPLASASYAAPAANYAPPPAARLTSNVAISAPSSAPSVSAKYTAHTPSRASSASVPPLPMVAQTTAAPSPAAQRDPVPRWLWIAIGFVGAGAVVGGGWYFLGPNDPPVNAHGPVAIAGTAKVDARPAPVAVPRDAGSAAVAVVPRDAGSAAVAVVPHDAGSAAVAVVLHDAGSAAVAVVPRDAGSAAVAVAPRDAAPTPTPTKAASDDKALVIESSPAGARVYLDGADQGVTPVKLAGSADHHSVALVLPNHDLYLAEIDGHGRFNVALTAVTPLGGSAGIKVRCKDKDRYYVFVDGKPTGQLCPTEKIEVERGDHVVEVYDVTTETRRQFPAVVKSNDRSLRVRID